MSCIYVSAKEGHKWAITELGLEDGRIRGHFCDKSSNRKQYEKKVPKNWIDKGLVVEVKI